MLFARCRGLLLFYGALQQMGWPQNIQESRWDESVKQILLSEGRGNLPSATRLAERLVDDLQRDDPGGALLPEVVDRLAHLQRRQGKFEDAQRLYENAVLLWQKRPDSPSTGLATELNNLASLYSETGKFTQAEVTRRQSLTLRLRLLGPAHPQVALSCSNLASDMFRQGKYAEAETLAHEAIEVWERVPLKERGEDLAYDTLAMIRVQAGDYNSALRFIRLALQTYFEQGVTDGARLAEYQHVLALTQEGSGDTQGASRTFQIALADLQQANPAGPIQRLGILRDYALLLRRMGQRREAHKVETEVARESKELSNDHAFKYSVDVGDLLREPR